MKSSLPSNTPLPQIPQGSGSRDFLNGLVFGFDVGTGSIGYAVRQGRKFLHVGVLICDSEGSDLSKRRELRRQRRTLRSKKYRRKWFSRELATLLGIELMRSPDDSTPPLPKSAWVQNKSGGWMPSPDFASLRDPIALRIAALDKNTKLRPEELFTALSHLFRRRGYTKVPWAKERKDEAAINDDEKRQIECALGEIRQEMSQTQCKFPCQLLAIRKAEAGKSPDQKWGRKIYWPRDLLEMEFRAIAAAQAEHFPALAERADWLLYGDTREMKDFHVYFKSTEGRNPGVLGLKFPRFDNRAPALDSLQPLDAHGRPLHVVRRASEAFANAQWELALMNFRVLDVQTRQKIDPRKDFPKFIESLQEEWKRKGKVTIARLKKLAQPYAENFLLVEGQEPLTPSSTSGRARYASPTLEWIREEIAAGRRVDPPQPVLKRDGETAQSALNRYLADIKHPLVRHRLILFRNLLESLVRKYSQPDFIVLEAVRSLALGAKKKAELNKRNDAHRKDRDTAREELRAAGRSTSRKAITRYRLWKETQGICPFCCQAISHEQILNGEADIEHLVPRSLVDCSELYNLTVGHIHCNRDVKGNLPPHAAFSQKKDQWEQMKTHAQKCFKGRKLEIFLSPDAESLVERATDLQHTAYIARMIRGAALLQLGWIGTDGRDPTIEKGNVASSAFQVTNGQLTSRLRSAWGLNQILHPLPHNRNSDSLSDSDKQKSAEKNRGDFRHHAIDAMVIASTLPWLAHRTHGATDESGNHGWWTQDEKLRSHAANPVFGDQMHEVVKREIENVVVHHHVSRSRHRQAYATTLYAKKAPGTYVAREVFTTLTPKNLGNIWPPDFAAYCKAAWARYSDEAEDLYRELKTTKGCVPESFTKRLCFSHFQSWRDSGAPEFSWPLKIKIPIRNVRCISVKDDTAVMPFSRGTRAYVKRTGFKEVRIYPAANGKGFVPVFVPYWKGDKPIFAQPIQDGSAPVTVIRRGMVVETKAAFSTGQPPGKYRVLATSQVQLRLLPHHVANNEEAILAFGLNKKGIQPRWPDFIRALGYRLPSLPTAR